MTKQLKIVSLMGIVLSLVGFVRPASAHTEGACKEDAQKFCGDVKPGGGAIMDCMKTHQADLSQACKDNIAEGKAKMEAKHQEIETACKADVKQFCANVTPGQGREMACLKSYEDKISAGCKAKLPMRGMHKGMGHPGDHNQGGDAPGGDGTPPPPEAK